MKTDSKHKEITPRGIKNHAEHVKNLKQKLCGYGIDPFSNDAPRYLATDKIIEAAIVPILFEHQNWVCHNIKLL